MPTSIALPVPVPRRWRVQLALLAIVVGAHAWLLLAWTPRSAVDEGTAAPLQVRQITLSASAEAAPRREPAPDGDAQRRAAAEPRALARAVAPVAPSMAPPVRVADDSAAPRRFEPADATAAAPASRSTGATAAAAPTDPTDPTEPQDTHASPTGAAPFDPAALRAPTHDVDLPPAVTLHYRLQRGARDGEATLRWQREGTRYTLDVSGRIAGIERFGWSSRGGFDAAGLAPERFVVRRRERDAAAVNFRRDTNPAITFSGPQLTLPLPAGVQDRASWLVQFVAIVRALPGPVAPGVQVALPVVGPRGDLSLWVFIAGAPEMLDLPESAGRPDGTTTTAQPWRREAARPRDLEVQVWLDAARGQLPVQWRITAQPDGGSTEWRLRALQSS